LRRVGASRRARAIRFALARRALRGPAGAGASARRCGEGGRDRRLRPRAAVRARADAPADTAPGGYYLTGVYVRYGERRRGVGAALIRSRLEWIGTRATEAWFFTNARNTVSIELHRRLGFEEVTRTFSFPGLAFEGGEGILFHCQLAPEDRSA